MNEIERKARREIAMHRIEFGPPLARVLGFMTPPLAALPKMFAAKRAALTKAPRRK